MELDPLAELACRHDRYPRAAYEFVLAGLERTVSELPEHRHISGKELLKGLSRYARESFGPMTLDVLHDWGIRETMDFGRIVFHLVEAKQLSRTEEDSIEDFADGYDFEQEFGGDFDWMAELRGEKTSRKSNSG